MKRNYTATVGFELAKMLREVGFPQEIDYDGLCYVVKDFSVESWVGGKICEEVGNLTTYDTENNYPIECLVAAPSYADVFDWLMENGVSVEVAVWHFPRNERYDFCVDARGGELYNPDVRYDAWQKAATAAVEYALKVISHGVTLEEPEVVNDLIGDSIKAVRLQDGRYVTEKLAKEIEESPNTETKLN